MKIFILALACCAQLAAAQTTKQEALDALEKLDVIHWTGELIEKVVMNASSQRMSNIDGFVSIFVGQRKENVSRETFSSQMAEHGVM